jgi:hypothetical protein
MDFEQLRESLLRWERDGTIVPGEGIIAGLHEPQPQPGAIRVGSVNDEVFVVQMLDADGKWRLLRSYDTEEKAAEYVSRRLGKLSSRRYWGDERWDRISENVRRGSILRAISLLLVPRWDLVIDRWDLLEHLQELGVQLEGRYWIEGVHDRPSNLETILQLHQATNSEWVVGVQERGMFHEWGRFSVEADACRRMLQTIVGHTVTTMGVGTEMAHIVPSYQERVRRAMTEAFKFIEDPQGERDGPS